MKMSGGKRLYQRPSLQNVLEYEFFIKTLIEISQMVNCRSEEWKTFDVRLLWTFDSVSLADTVRSWWSLSRTMFSISLFSSIYTVFLLKNLFETTEILPALPPPVTSILRWSSLNPEIKKKGNVAFIGWKRFPQTRMIQNHQRCSSHTGVIKFFQHWGVFFFLLIFLYMWGIWFYRSSMASEDDSHLSSLNFLIKVGLVFIT